MSTEMRRVLDLLASGRITVDEADQLLSALNEPPASTGSPSVPADVASPKYLRINVHKTAREGQRPKDVNIRVPLAIVRGGLRLGALIPGFRGRLHTKLHDSGVEIDLSKIDADAIESLLKDMGQVNIDVNGGEEQVRITCE